jgi:hypothetical protein
VYSRSHGRFASVSSSECDAVIVCAASADALRYATHLVEEELCKLSQTA